MVRSSTIQCAYTWCSSSCHQLGTAFTQIFFGSTSSLSSSCAKQVDRYSLASVYTTLSFQKNQSRKKTETMSNFEVFRLAQMPV